MTVTTVAPLSRVEWVFLLLAMAATLALGVVATESGPGISPDSTGYLRTAINLQAGQGFTLITATAAPDGVAVPFTSQPPVFPTLLALAGLVQPGRAGIEAAGRWLPIFAAMLALLPLYLIGRMLAGAAAGAGGVLFAAALSNYVWLASYTWSDTTFILWVSLGLAGMIWLAIVRPGRRRLVLAWVLLGLLAALANLTRTVGFFLWLAGAVASLQATRYLGWRETLVPGGAFTLVWAGLTVPWYLRNLRLAGTLSGYAYVTDRVHLDWFDAARTLALTAAGDLAPRLHLGLRTLPLGVLFVVGTVVLMVVLVVLSRALRRHPPQLTTLMSWQGWPLTTYVGASLAGLMVIGATIQIYPGEWTRYAGSVYPFLGMLLAVMVVMVLRWLATDLPPVRQRQLALAAAALALVVWSLGYAKPVAGFAQAAGAGQQLQSLGWRSSAVAAFVRDMVPGGALIFTDRTDAIWFLTGRNAAHLPLMPSGAQGLAGLWEKVAKGSDQAYLVIFTGDHRDPFRMSTDTLLATDHAACLRMLKRAADGDVLSADPNCIASVAQESG